MRDEDLMEMLATAKPAAAKTNATEIAFEAGRRAGERSATRWRAASAAMACALAALIAWPRYATTAPSGSRSMPTVIAVITPVPKAPGYDSDQTAYGLTRLVAEHGIDALPRAGGLSNSSPDIRVGSFYRGDL